MKIVETKGKIAEDGSIILPPGVLKNMCVEAGDTVSLAYLTHHPVKAINSYGEFFISKNGIDQLEEPVKSPEQAELQLPHELLEAAGIPLEGDLDIRCVPGVILIGSNDPLFTVNQPLLSMLSAVGIPMDEIYAALAEGGYYYDEE
jgi:hypothetical protein